MVTDSITSLLDSLTEEFIPSEARKVRIAESQSLSPDVRIGQLSVANPINAMHAIMATLVVLEESQGEYWLTDRWVKQMIEKCYRQQYEGYWATLQILLQTSYLSQEYEDNLIILIGAHSYYGNWYKLKRIYKKTLKLLTPANIERRKRRKKKSSHRGYRDKGSSVPDYAAYRRKIPPARSEVERIDKRNLVRHPLLQEKNINPGRDPPTQHLPALLQALREEVNYRKELISLGSQQSETVSREDSERDSGTEEIKTRVQKESSQKSRVKENEVGNRDQGNAQVPQERNEGEQHSSSRISSA